ncbi:hypothetical protein [Actinacidiphila acididurans]|uniref:Bacterial repeat domain-containing protein n=1 Tax=Actinacidiphila acididurans TaxID=2784346 RepID=A0ABS2U3B8_9ACTN|nr:hypothetical protein [Actinacidiphila acididurans]MBM9510105.1 hypothetical protein [Actinacidiphila acididurans]
MTATPDGSGSVTVTADGTSTPCDPGGCHLTYHDSRTVRLTAVPGDEYRPSHWSGDCAGTYSDVCVLNSGTGITAEAVFEADIR